MDNKEKKDWITEGVIIALVPFLGYLFAFEYESGYAIFFNFPKEFINIGLPQIIITISILYTITILLFFYIEGLSFMLFKNRRALYHSIIKLLPMFGLSIGYYFAFGGMRALPFFIVFLVFGFSEFIVPLITQRDKKDYESKLQAYDDADWKFREERGALSVRLIKLFGYKNIIFIFNLLVCVFLTQTIGEIAASRKIMFFVMPNNPQKVVVRIYGDNLICAPFDKETKTIKRDISIYKLTDPEARNLKFEILGPLKVEKSEDKTKSELFLRK